MKKRTIFIWIIMIVVFSCTKSRFATTTRHYRDGRVVYTNHYASERSNLHRSRSGNSTKPTRDEPAKTDVNAVRQPLEVLMTNHIASPGNNILADKKMEKHIVSPGNEFTGNAGVTNLPVIPDDHSPLKAGTSKLPVPPDDHLARKHGTSDLAASPADHPEVDGNLKNLAGPRSGMARPDFRSEKEVTPSNTAWSAINKSPDKLSVGEPARTGDTTLNKVVTGKAKPAKKNHATGPKTEKLGLAGFILSFFGIVPLFGIPFAVLAIVFGFKSLGKIKRNPGKYKGKGFATASIVIGIAMIVMNIVVLIVSINAANNPPKIHYNTSANTCRV